MSANELDKKVDQIRDLKRLIEEAETEITGIEDEIRARMTELDTDELSNSPGSNAGAVLLSFNGDGRKAEGVPHPYIGGYFTF